MIILRFLWLNQFQLVLAGIPLYVHPSEIIALDLIFFKGSYCVSIFLNNIEKVDLERIYLAPSEDANHFS